MAAYFIANVDVHDPKAIEEYRQGVPATVAKYGGRFLVRGGGHSRLEGQWEPTRLVILEFPSMEQAKRWYDSPEYRDLKALRVKAASTDLVLVEGA
jgi:uncharacterized protein (DUF1330 family)